MQILFTPLVAFLIFLVLAVLITILGRSLAGPSKYSRIKFQHLFKRRNCRQPCWRRQVIVPSSWWLCFLQYSHLGVLVLGSGVASPVMRILLIGFNASTAGFDSRLRGYKYEMTIIMAASHRWAKNVGACQFAVGPALQQWFLQWLRY